MSANERETMDVNKIACTLLEEMSARTFTREELHRVLTFCDGSLSTNADAFRATELGRRAVEQLEAYAFPPGVIGFFVRGFRKAFGASTGATAQEALWACKYNDLGKIPADAAEILLSRQSKDDLLLLVSRNTPRKEEAGKLLLDHFGHELSFDQHLLLLRNEVCLEEVRRILKTTDGLTSEQMLWIVEAFPLGHTNQKWWAERWLKECRDPSVRAIQRMAGACPDVRDECFERLLDVSSSPVVIAGIAAQTDNLQVRDRAMHKLLAILTPTKLARYPAGHIEQWQRPFVVDEKYFRTCLCGLVRLEAYRADLLALFEGIRLDGAECFMIHCALPHDHPGRQRFAEEVWQNVLHEKVSMNLRLAVIRGADRDLAFKIAEHTVRSRRALPLEREAALYVFPELVNSTSTLDLISEHNEAPAEPKKNPPDERFWGKNDGIRP